MSEIFWCVQKNIFNELSYEQMIETIVKTDDEYSIVDVIPFTNNIEPEINSNKIIIPIGSTKLVKIAKSRNWVGVFYTENNFNFLEWKKNWGKHLLNFHSDVVLFKDLHEFSGDMFVRPIHDLKMFSGAVLSNKEIPELRNTIKSYYNDDIDVENILCMRSPLNVLDREYRCYVIANQVVTASLYRLNKRVVYRNDVEQEVYDYVNSRVNEWSPAEAFVIDIAMTPEGLKIIEINCINSAGIYACDSYKIIDGLRNLLLER